MIIQQFEDKFLSHFSYAILSERKIALVDPGRDPQPYYDYAKQHNAVITAVFETHPHADFISSHAEIHRETGAPVFVSKKLSPGYPYRPFDDGSSFSMGKVEFSAINTPGHSPDSICIFATEEGEPGAVFTGDTLFIGDCGRPDLRENAGALTEKRDELARKMYHSLREKLAVLPGDTRVFPTHGAGSLCGRGLSAALSSTMTAEKATNWSLQEMDEDDFVKELLKDQPFVPKYFENSVNLNRQGAPDLAISIYNVNIHGGIPEEWDESVVIIDSRKESLYKQGALKNSINLMADGKFETWLGSIIAPQEPFYLIADSTDTADVLIRRIAKIGYEEQIRSVWIVNKTKGIAIPSLDAGYFKDHTDEYTIVDVRNASEMSRGKLFDNAIAIPLYELRERVDEIPGNKPVVVHCAAGYRSAAGTSIVKNRLNGSCEVFDLGTDVLDYLTD